MNLKKGQIYKIPRHDCYWICTGIGKIDDVDYAFGLKSTGKDSSEYTVEQLFLIKIEDLKIYINLNMIHNIEMEDTEDPLFDKNYEFIAQIDDEVFDTLKTRIKNWRANQPKES